MDEDIKINKWSIILFMIFAILIVILILVINNPSTSTRPHVGRYTTSVPISDNSKKILGEYGINANGKIQYELILKNDDTFILYVTGIKKVAYTGNYDKGFNKYLLKTFKIYDINKNCFTKHRYEYLLKPSNKTLVTSEITNSEIAFIKYDDNITKYDKEISSIYLECGSLND